jgi:hypothetical protein
LAVVAGTGHIDMVMVVFKYMIWSKEFYIGYFVATKLFKFK